MKRVLSYICIIAIVMSVFAIGASAEKVKIGKRIGLLTEGESVSLGDKLKGVSPSDLQWSISDQAVISASGATITGLQPGLAIATAGYAGKTVSMGVVVLPQSVQIGVGESIQLPYGGVEKYAVQNSKIAKVNAKGVVYGIAAGTTNLRVRFGKQNKYVTVNVAGQSVPDVSQSKAAGLACAATATQIVLVEYKSGSSAEVSIHEKTNGVWKELGSCSAYVGKNGIGKTKEGDKKTPAGTYNLTIPFGIKADPGSKLPYTQVTKYHYWCGKSSSQYYNQLVDTRVTGTKVTSSDEYLINYKGVYNYCMFIDYNAQGVAGKGSCIFLHCKGKNKYTAGCVAVDESFMKKIIQWADTGCKIVIQ